MPKASTSSATLTKVANALNTLRNDLSTTEYRRFEAKAFSTRFEITHTFSTVLRNLGAIQMNPEQRGEYRLTAKMAGLRPSTVLKHINQYQSESKKRASTLLRRKRKAKAPAQQYLQVVTPPLFPVSNESSFETIIIALKERIRKEVMAEFYDLVSK